MEAGNQSLWFALAIFVFVVWMARTLIRYLDGPQKTSNEEPETPAAKWRALPGNILEPGDTGFQIRFKPDQHRHQFAAYDPEGLCRASSEYLQPLKNICENMAADRAQFLCDVEGWKP